jgi:hypothetical protein
VKTERVESPTVFAKRIGLWGPPRHSSLGVLSWDDVLDMAADIYWDRRPHVDAA